MENKTKTFSKARNLTLKIPSTNSGITENTSEREKEERVVELTLGGRRTGA